MRKTTSHLSAALSIFIAPFRCGGICRIRKRVRRSQVGYRATTYPLLLYSKDPDSPHSLGINISVRIRARLRLCTL